MKYIGMPPGMWMLFAGSFRKHLSLVCGYDPETAKSIARRAKRKYREIIRHLPEFEKADRFKLNIVNCAMFSAFLLSLPKKPAAGTAAEYYRASMMTAPMKWFCRMSGKKKFHKKDLQLHIQVLQIQLLYRHNNQEIIRPYFHFFLFQSKPGIEPKVL